MTRAVRGRLLSFAGDPAETKDAVRYWPDGMVAIEAGRIAAVGDARAIAPTLPPHTQVDHYPDRLVLPGLIRHSHPLRPGRGDRLVRPAPARLAGELRFRRRAEICRPGFRGAAGALLPRRAIMGDDRSVKATYVQGERVTLAG